MKSVVADPETRVTCARIETTGGLVFRFAWYPHDIIMSNGEVYISDPFYQPTDIASGTNMAPVSFDSQGFFDATGITRDQLLSGLMDNAKGFTFETSWAAPIEDEEEQKQTIFGKSFIQDEVYTIEHMSLLDVTNQSIGSNVHAKCTWTLFDETLDSTTLIATDRSRCSGPRAAQDGPVLSDFVVTGTVTGVTSNTEFEDTGRLEATGYFNYGSILWLTGDNAGTRSMTIKTSVSGGGFVTHAATHKAIQVGDTYKAIPGCDHTRSGDCITKFDNAINCNAFEDVITEEEYTSYGTGA